MTEFDELYYEKLTDGLEVSEVSYKYIKKASDIFRFDSFYYAKEFLNNENLIERRKNFLLRDLAVSLKSFGAYSLNNLVEYQESGIPFIRGVNMKSGLIDFDGILYITEKVNKILYKSEIFPETLLLSMSGTIGDVAIALPDWKYPLNSNQDIAKIMIDRNLTSPYYVYIFLRSKYGQNYLKREARGSVQQHVFLSQMELFRIPVFSEKFTLCIQEIVKKGLLCYEDSKIAMKEAEELLVQILELKNLNNQNEVYSIKSFKNSFKDTGRMDAEYYQKKYDVLFKILTKFHCEKLGKIVKIKKSIEPGSDCYSDTGIPFVRVSDMTKYGITEPKIKLPSNLVDNIEDLFLEKGTILLSKDGSVGIAYRVEEDMQFITSGALLHLKVLDENEVNPDYLTVLLNSKAVQMQAERDAGGSIIQHWKPSEIADVIIPILGKNIQNEIANRAKKSFVLRKESQKILCQVVEIVETAIEQGEDVALKKCKLEGKYEG